MGSTITTFRALLKERYLNSSLVEKLTYPQNTLLSMLEKKGDTGFVGYDLPVPFFYGNPQGFAGDAFSTAQTNATNTKSDRWVITAGDYFGVVHIGDKVFQLSRSNQGAFLDNKRSEIDGLYEQAGDNMSAYLWGNGGGALGRRASLATNTVQLASPSDIAKFEMDMFLAASSADGSAAADALRAGTYPSVTGINRSLGQVTLSNAANITSFADGDYLFRQGDFFGNTGTIVIKGVQCFVTATDSPMTLWGITDTTRATDPQRYAGCRMDPNEIAGKTYEERILRLFAFMTGRYKAKAPTAGFMHPENFQQLVTLMSARGIRPLEDQNTKFGFMKIDVMTTSGSVPIYTDRHCPKDEFFALRMEDWGLSSIGELFHPQTVDGSSGDLLRRASSTDYEFRLLSYPALTNRAPKNSGRVPLES